MRALLSLVLCLSGGVAVADASLGDMPPVDSESPILRGFADGHPMMPGPDLWVLYAFDDSAMRVGDTAQFFGFAEHIFSADNGGVVDHVQQTDKVGLSYYPPFAVVVLDGALVDYPLVHPSDDTVKTISRLFEGDAEVARLMNGGAGGSLDWLSHVLFIDIASLDHTTVSECAARLAVATLYTSTIPEDFNFTRCAESLQ